MVPLSIYIHWPFCLSLCPYCDFNSHIANSIDQQLWLNAYLQELQFFQDKIKRRKIKSIFFGGGTPSLMEPFVIENIINIISKLGVIDKTTEITLEVNPTSYETNKFIAFKSAGINRVSIGVQSFEQEALTILGRKHSVIEAQEAICSASKIFHNFSFDLIYARPKQNLLSWQKELNYALDFAGNHISLYQLTIEKGTEYFKTFRQNSTLLPSEDEAALMYEWTTNHLREKGYHRYEISNYAKPKYECIHNLCYWNYNEYLGIGPGAHSRLHFFSNDNLSYSIQALMMLHNPQKWLAYVFSKGSGIQMQKKLSDKEVIEEILMMGSRLSIGVKEASFTKITGIRFSDILNEKIFQQFIHQGLIYYDKEYLRLSNDGILLHNYLIVKLLS